VGIATQDIASCVEARFQRDTVLLHLPSSSTRSMRFARVTRPSAPLRCDEASELRE
jgi:hypothetical protein